MSVYLTRPRKGPYGYVLGILVPDEPGLFEPGDLAHAGSFDFPVLYGAVPGLKAGTPATQARADAVVTIARDLESRGVRGLLAASAALLPFQREVAATVRIPVMLSPLLQLPLAGLVLPVGRAIGIVTGDSHAASRAIDELQLNAGNRRLHTAELGAGQDCSEAALVQLAKQLGAQPEVGALLLEDGRMCRHARAVHEATGLPVFDALSLARYIKSGVRQRAYTGYY